VVRLEYFAPTGWLDTWIEARDGERLRHWRHVWLRRTLDERTLYTYDERGNWIRREKQLRLPDGSWFDDGFAIVREIEYYD
jgi:hypothetical protein